MAYNTPPYNIVFLVKDKKRNLRKTQYSCEHDHDTWKSVVDCHNTYVKYKQPNTITDSDGNSFALVDVIDSRKLDFSRSNGLRG